MKQFEEASRHVFTKLPEEYPLPPQEFEITGLTLEGLTEAFIRIWSRKPALDDNPESNHYAPRNIRRDSHTVQECMLELITAVKKKRLKQHCQNDTSEDNSSGTPAGNSFNDSTGNTPGTSEGNSSGTPEADLPGSGSDSV